MIEDLTFPEVENLLKGYQRARWEERLWHYALLTTKPFDTFAESIKELQAEDEEPTPTIDELPKVQQDWLRAT